MALTVSEQAYLNPKSGVSGDRLLGALVTVTIGATADYATVDPKGLLLTPIATGLTAEGAGTLYGFVMTSLTDSANAPKVYVPIFDTVTLRLRLFKGDGTSGLVEIDPTTDLAVGDLVRGFALASQTA